MTETTQAYSEMTRLNKAADRSAWGCLLFVVVVIGAFLYRWLY